MTNIPPTQKLHNPSLTLYGYHLRHTISQGIEETLPEASSVWEQLSDIGQVFQIQQLHNIKQQLVCFQNDNYQPAAEDRLGAGNYFNLLRGGLEEITFQLSRNISGANILGSVTPFRVNDTYALDLTLRVENSLEISQLDQLNLKSHLSSSSVTFEPSLGQTLLFYAETTISEQYYGELAQNCVSQLTSSNSDLELVGSGKILGCSVFVYDNWEVKPSKQKHILLCFNPHSTAPEKLERASKDLLFLMCSHHKILYAYDQSRSCQRKSKPLYTYLEDRTNKFSETAQSDDRLPIFKQLLTKLPQKSLEYAKLLRDLEDHKNTIRTNILNYKKLINQLQQLPESDLAFLQPFLAHTQNKFYRQIQVDQSFLIPGKEMFQELISNIRGIVTIDQVESDRQFQIELQARDEQFQQTLNRQERQLQQTLQEQQKQFQTQLQDRSQEFQSTLEQQRIQRDDDLSQQQDNEERREKKIESWIAFFGTGLAVSGISSGVVTEPTKTILTNISRTLPPICHNNDLICYFCYSTIDILFHVLVGLVFAFPIVFLINFIRNRTQ